MRRVILVSLLLLLSSCGTTGAIYGMYMKRNYMMTFMFASLN